MAWFKVDDQLAFNMKVLSAGNAAMGLWVRAGSWSAAQLSDGLVPAPIVAALGGSADDADALVQAGLWHPVEGGWVFHDWAVYQPTKEQVLADRKATRDRVAKYRAARAASNGGGNAAGNAAESGVSNGVTPDAPEGVTAGVSTDAPTRPDPTRPSSSNELEISLSSEAAEAAPRPDVERLLDLLDAGIIGNGGKAPSRNRKNRDAMRLLLDRDGRTPGQVEAAIRWCQADEFWRGNILSASKLREKYDQLRLAAQRTGRAAGASRAEERQRHNLSVVEQFAAAETTKGLTS